MYRLCSEEGLNCELDRTLVFTGHNQEWPHKVIPVSDEIKDKYSCIYSLGNRHNNLEESSCRTTSINCSRLDQIIWNIRLPRTLTGALVGANLALSGAILQAVMRNPLADPHIIGISAGAGLAGIVVLIVWPAYLFWMTPVAFIGAMAAAAVIYLLAWKDGIVPVRIILAGVAVSAFLGAIISGILIFYSDRVHGALLWMVGGLAASSWKDVTAIAPYTVIGLALSAVGAYYLNLLQLGDDMARSLGLSVEGARLGLTAVAALLAASAVSE